MHCRSSFYRRALFSVHHQTSCAVIAGAGLAPDPGTVPDGFSECGMGVQVRDTSMEVCSLWLRCCYTALPLLQSASSEDWHLWRRCVSCLQRYRCSHCIEQVHRVCSLHRTMHRSPNEPACPLQSSEYLTSECLTGVGRRLGQAIQGAARTPWTCPSRGIPSHAHTAVLFAGATKSGPCTPRRFVLVAEE